MNRHGIIKESISPLLTLTKGGGWKNRTLSEESQLINTEEMRGFENPWFIVTNVRIDSASFMQSPRNNNKTNNHVFVGVKKNYPTTLLGSLAVSCKWTNKRQTNKRRILTCT